MTSICENMYNFCKQKNSGAQTMRDNEWVIKWIVYRHKRGTNP